MNTNSSFPNNVDDLVYFQDIDLSSKEVIVEYKKYLENKEYTKATEVLTKSNVDYYGSEIFNLIENRIHNLQTYFINNPKINPHIFSSTKPTNIKNGTMWIG